MSDITINFDGDDVIIRGPKSILKISIDPTASVQRIIEPAPLDVKKPTPKIKKNKIIDKSEYQAKKNIRAGRNTEKRYYCIECKKVFLSTASKLDAVCPGCNSIHIGYASQHNK